YHLDIHSFPTRRSSDLSPFACLAVADLAFGVDAVEEQLAVLLDHAADAQALDDVRADSNDFHDGRTFAGDGFHLLILAEQQPGCKIPLVLFTVSGLPFLVYRFAPAECPPSAQG